MASGTRLVQLCTWNDWGEGTQIEPSMEFGYRDLEAVQNLRFAGQADRPTPADLRLPFQLLALRRQFAADPSKTAVLYRIVSQIAKFHFADARLAIATIR